MYDLSIHYPSPSHIALSPFEKYREPLVVIAIADGVELENVGYRGNVRRSLMENGNGPPKPEHNLRELYQDLEDLKDRYPKALVHELVLFDYVHKTADSIPEGIVIVPPPEQCKVTTIKTIMCDMSSMLLAEMTTLAKSLQGLPTIDSPTHIYKAERNDAPWAYDQEEPSRRNSQYSIPNQNMRSESPAGRDRSHVRMSMPVQLRRTDSDNSSPAGRSVSPLHATNASATTFEEIVGGSSSDNRIPSKSLASRLTATSESSRDTSRDRVSVSGFGSNSVSERARNKNKGRIGVVIGSLYLQAGRWVDAIKELSEATQVAKMNLDHLWHAKALDHILVSMLMLAWTGLDFQIPSVCYASAEKVPATTNSSSGKTPAANRMVSLQNLVALLPELLDRILNLYTRAANNTGESLPQYPYSESVLRFSKLLALIHVAGGTLDDEVLESIVKGTHLSNSPSTQIPRLSVRPSKTDIASTLFRGLPVSPSPESLSLVDRVVVLGGIAFVLGMLGYKRKKAMVVRELVSVLIPGLVQARIKGAAEMGVHPAAGLAALSAANGTVNSARTLELADGDIESGLDVFLGLLSDTYGVVASNGLVDDYDDRDEAIVERIMKSATLRAFGGQNLKMDILRSCINLCEALPDFNGALRFTADLLRTAGSGIAPGPRTDNASPSMTRDEQIRLSTNISRTIGAARNIGIKDVNAEYWDEFLVRGVEVDISPLTKSPIPHKRSELPGAVAATTSKPLNPFIYNPFLKQPDTSAANQLLVAGETAHFKVTLQNPYEFEVEIESIKLETTGSEFEANQQKTTIGPYRTQILSVTGIPKVAGALSVTGCIVKIRGCRERRFPIFTEPWAPQNEVKVKHIGVSSLSPPKDRPVSAHQAPHPLLPAKVPVTSTTTVNVIAKQPIVKIEKTSLFQSAVMVLEGERQTFSITLRNTSEDTPVDFLLFSFKDSTQASLQAAMSNREATPAELYEYELIFTRKQALRWKRNDGKKVFIGPGKTASFEVEVLGRPGLTTASVQIDYAYLGVSAEDYPESFHTRQVTLPLTVTVNASVELVRMDVLPLTSTTPIQLHIKNGDHARNLTPQDYCLLILDLRNAWPSQLQLQLNIDDENTVDEEVLPGVTSRIMVPIRKIFLGDPSAAIPTLDPSRQRQFVVSASRVSADSERSAREAFWYREEVLRMLRGTWRTKSGPPRNGDVELRGLRLSQRMIDAVKIDEIGIEILAQDASGVATHVLEIDASVDIKIKLTNRSTQPILPLLRMQPSVRNQPHTIALDLAKKFIWNGVLQQALPLLPSKESIEVTIGMTPLCRGEFEINALVEEAMRLGEDEERNKEVGAEQRPRANTGSLMDALRGARERRVWCCRESCVVTVRDGDGEDEED